MIRLAPVLILMAGTATAQQAETFDFKFRAGVGVQSAPDYFGADSASTEATGSFEFGSLTAFGRCFGCDDTPGLGFTGSFRYIGARDEIDTATAAEIAEAEIATLFPAVDATVELGGGLSYSTDDVETFAVIRRGFGGHEGYVAELGGDLILRPNDQLRFEIGPRLLAGDGAFLDTYFSSDPDRSDGSSVVHDAGLVSRGLVLSATYNVTDTWGVTATARYDQLLDDAAASRITANTDQTTVSLVLTRAFDW